MDQEKAQEEKVENFSGPKTPQDALDLEQAGNLEGYVLNDVGLAHEHGFKTTADGNTILIPQPSDSPHDPLNWSPFRKHLILIIISCTAFLPDYGSATGAVALDPQGE